MVETFLRPFEMCVKEGDVSSIMCTNQRLNGIPTCADPGFLNATLRGDWNFDGYISVLKSGSAMLGAEVLTKCNTNELVCISLLDI